MLREIEPFLNCVSNALTISLISYVRTNFFLVCSQLTFVQNNTKPYYFMQDAICIALVGNQSGVSCYDQVILIQIIDSFKSILAVKLDEP